MNVEICEASVIMRNIDKIIILANFLHIGMKNLYTTNETNG